MADSNGYLDDNSGGFITDSEGTWSDGQGDITGDYSRWDWRRIMTAIRGGAAYTDTTAHTERAARASNPQNVQDAANTLYYTEQVLQEVAQAITDQTNALTGENGPWQGPAAQALNRAMADVARQTQAMADVLSGGVTGDENVPQQLANNAQHLREAIAKVNDIDIWYAQQAAELDPELVMDNGQVRVSASPQIVKMMSDDMRQVLIALASRYELNKDSIRQPHSPSNPNNAPDSGDSADQGQSQGQGQGQGQGQSQGPGPGGYPYGYGQGDGQDGEGQTAYSPNGYNIQGGSGDGSGYRFSPALINVTGNAGGQDTYGRQSGEYTYSPDGYNVGNGSGSGQGVDTTPGYVHANYQPTGYEPANYQPTGGRSYGYGPYGDAIPNGSLPVELTTDQTRNVPAQSQEAPQQPVHFARGVPSSQAQNEPGQWSSQSDSYDPSQVTPVQPVHMAEGVPSSQPQQPVHFAQGVPLSQAQNVPGQGQWSSQSDSYDPSQVTHVRSVHMAEGVPSQPQQPVHFAQDTPSSQPQQPVHFAQGVPSSQAQNEPGQWQSQSGSYDPSQVTPVQPVHMAQGVPSQPQQPVHFAQGVPLSQAQNVPGQWQSQSESYDPTQEEPRRPVHASQGEPAQAGLPGF
ncbi:hypothetical protein [Streptomyces sp. NPDC005573]|uniref:hypothetical protein n=1 Tax=Streptomyces sp. NPDC005573 TaxID=3156890 RepID=UPI0033B2ED98